MVTVRIGLIMKERERRHVDVLDTHFSSVCIHYEIVSMTLGVRLARVQRVNVVGAGRRAVERRVVSTCTTLLLLPLVDDSDIIHFRLDLR